MKLTDKIKNSKPVQKISGMSRKKKIILGIAAGLIVVALIEQSCLQVPEERKEAETGTVSGMEIRVRARSRQRVP